MMMTALVCTRNRGAVVGAAILSILANDHADFELIVVDQSRDDLTETAIAPMLHDPRLRYVRSSESGLSNARNLGIGQAKSTIVAMTDDDCIVPFDWITRMERAFQIPEPLAIVVGNVVAASYDNSKGFVPSYSQTTSFIAKNLRGKHRIEGMAACMGIKVETWRRLSGFDPMLGAGSPFHSADETDMIIRALLEGHRVMETPDVVVTHRGLRSWDDADSTARNYLYGIGATIAKHIKLFNWSIAYVAIALAGRWIFARPAMDYGFRPGRHIRLIGFLTGFRDGLLTSVDRRTGHFLPPALPPG